jgi:RNA 2',3'-cyclic 3'-phosphodiesterase
MRLFLAIELPDDVRAALGSEQSRLRALCSRNRAIRWAAPESLHLTLKFLGDVAQDRVPALTDAVKRAGVFAPFEVEARGFGFFPDAKRPRVFWAGFEAPAALGELARRLDAALATLGFAHEDRPFTPHLTLARFREPRGDPALLKRIEQVREASLGRFQVERYFLFQSHLLPGGAKHEKVASFPQP